MRVPWRVISAAVVVVAAVGISVWLVRAHSRLDSLDAYPEYGRSGPITVGETEYLGSNLTDGHETRDSTLTISIDSIRPVVDRDDAGATITVLRCVLAGDRAGPSGTGRADAESRCSSLTRFRSGRVRLGFHRGDDDIVLAVTPRHAGRVKISGLEVDYSSGWHRGHQHTGVDFDVRA